MATLAAAGPATRLHAPHSLQELLEGTGQRADPLLGNPRQQDQLNNRGYIEVYCDLKTKAPTEPSSPADTQTRRKAISMSGSGCPVHATRTDHAETGNPWSRSAKEYMSPFPRLSHDTLPHSSTQCSSIK